jgi:hypothetical protein
MKKVTNIILKPMKMILLLQRIIHRVPMVIG